MNLKFFCPRWGTDKLGWEEFFQKITEAGYDGFEYGISSMVTQEELQAVFQAAAERGLAVIAQHYDTYDSDFENHKTKYSLWFEKIRPFSPYKINSQTGKDFFSFEQNSAIIAIASNFAEQTGIVVVHETHRNKFPFAAHVTKLFLQALPGLKLTLDVSHWVNVAESYLEDQQEAMFLAVKHTEHIHARVGYPEGPQVPDPRVPEWAEAVDHHLAWWDQVVARKGKQPGNVELSITPEFGPYPYMVHLPGTNEPIASQWELNKFMMDLLRERYKVI